MLDYYAYSALQLMRFKSDAPYTNRYSLERAMGLTAKQQRTKRSLLNYGRNALGKLVRKQTFRDCDYTSEGHLVQFDDEAECIAFEEERYVSGRYQAHYSTKVRSTVPKEHLALD